MGRGLLAPISSNYDHKHRFCDPPLEHYQAAPLLESSAFI